MRASRAFVSYVPDVPTCLTCLHDLRPHVPYLPACLCAFASCLYRTSYEIAKILATNGFFPVRQLGVFSTGQMKFFCWVQEIGTMLLQRCCNISDAKIALQQLYYSQLWQAVCQFFTIFFRRYLTGYSYQR